MNNNPVSVPVGTTQVNTAFTIQGLQKIYPIGFADCPLCGSKLYVGKSYLTGNQLDYTSKNNKKGALYLGCTQAKCFTQLLKKDDLDNPNKKLYVHLSDKLPIIDEAIKEAQRYVRGVLKK